MAIIWAFIYSNLFGNSIGLNICGMWVIWRPGGVISRKTGKTGGEFSEANVAIA